jgi:predicted GNAT family acetyltransferase
LSNYQNHEEVIVPKFVVLEINFQGVHMIQKSRGKGVGKCQLKKSIKKFQVKNNNSIIPRCSVRHNLTISTVYRIFPSVAHIQNSSGRFETLKKNNKILIKFKMHENIADILHL